MTTRQRTYSVLLALLAVCCSGLGLEGRARAAVTYDAQVKALMDQVTQAELRPVVDDLSGVTSPLIGGSPYTITTRAYKSGTAIDKAEQYVYERLASYGLDSVAYAAYTGGGGGRNVVGQIDGRSPTRAGQIIIVAAHLDDYPWSGSAPGADDNASGVSAMLFLARAFAGRGFECTVRFVATGDEEHFGAGADEYAAGCLGRGENVVGVVVPDMLAYDNGTNTIELYVRPALHDPGAGDMTMARTYSDVIAAYGLGVLPVIIEADVSFTDADTFWDRGVHALDISEGWDPTNPFYHTANDKVATFSWSYYVTVAKGLTGTVAHLAGIDTTRPAVQSISSPTHPQAAVWYRGTTPSFSWTAGDSQTGVDGYSFVLDQAPDTVADSVSEGTATSWTSTARADGVWWFHLRVRDGAGNWSDTVHREVRIDSVAPVTADDAPADARVSCRVALTADDALSGVEQTEYRLDGGPWTSGASVWLTARRKRSGLTVVTPGTHTIDYRSTDVAGNLETVQSCTVRIRSVN